MHRIGTIFRLGIKPVFSEKEGEIAGIFAGDGSQHFDRKRYDYQVNVHFGKKNYWYALYVKNLFESFFKKRFRLNWDNSSKLRIRTESKEIFNFFANYLTYEPQVKHCTVRLKLNKLPMKFKIGFLRGLFDTDGCLKYIPLEKRTRLYYTTTSRILAKQVSLTLNKLEIKNSIYVRTPINEKTVYVVNIPKPATHKFINVVKPMKALRARSSVR